MSHRAIFSTKAAPAPRDGFEKARPDELLFTLLERDPCAPGAIEDWVDRRRKWARENFEGDTLREELQHCNDAEEIAWEMTRRQKGHADRVEPSKVKAYADDSPLEADSDAAWKIPLAEGVQLLREADSALADAAAKLDSLGLLDVKDDNALHYAHNTLQRLIRERTPKGGARSFSQRPTLEEIKR